MSEDTLRISEIFGPTLQGEGALAGRPTVFVRTGGCDYRCSWCDTLYAVESKYREEWKPMSAETVFAKVEALSGGRPILVTLSGGNPAIQDLGPLIKAGQEKNYSFALETQGSVAQDWFQDLDFLTLSPKPPSSGMETDWNILNQCINNAKQNTEITIKIVILNEGDYTYAKQVAERYPDLRVYLQPCNHKVERDPDFEGLNERMRWLSDRVLKDRWHSVSVLPQLHVMLWGNERGV